MYKQVLDPVAHSLGWSSLFAVLPIITLFVLLGVLRWKAQWAALASLAVSILVALIVYAMPVGQTADSALEGVAFGLWPIMWIVVTALWIYNMTIKSGHFGTLRRSFQSVSSDQRIQAVIIAFCFGALLEALAGFGTPVALCGAMLVAMGFRPIKAVSIALVANTAPVAFGAVAIPIVTLAQVTGLSKLDLGAMVGRQTPFLALVVPFILVGIVDGRRGLRQTWPAALTAGVGFAVAQFAVSNFVSVELSDVIASLFSAACVVGLLRIWAPGEPLRAPTVSPAPAAGASVSDPRLEQEITGRQPTDSRKDIWLAYAPYAIIIIVLGLAQLGPIKHALDSVTDKFVWPGLHVVNSKGKAPSSATFKMDYLSAAGTLLLISGLLTMAVLRVKVTTAAQTFWETIVQIRWAIMTVCAVLALAFVMNLSGQTTTMGEWAAGAGGAFAFLSPIIGWLGVALTGSDTSSNSLFGLLQVTAAHSSGLNPTLMAAANSSGGVLGKMLSPQNLAIGAAAVGIVGQEGDLFRRVFGWSLLLLLIMCVLALLQSLPVLSWMVV